MLQHRERENTSTTYRATHYIVIIITHSLRQLPLSYVVQSLSLYIDLLNGEGGYKDGRFLLRARPGTEHDLVLSLNFKVRKRLTLT
jgi:hypothetical protein